MHPQDNTTPPTHTHWPSSPSPMSYHRGLYAAELMEGLALVKEHKGLDDLSASARATKAATYKPRSSWEGISSAGTILKNEGKRKSKQPGLRVT